MQRKFELFYNQRLDPAAPIAHIPPGPGPAEERLMRSPETLAAIAGHFKDTGLRERAPALFRALFTKVPLQARDIPDDHKTVAWTYWHGKDRLNQPEKHRLLAKSKHTVKITYDELEHLFQIRTPSGGASTYHSIREMLRAFLLFACDVPPNAISISEQAGPEKWFNSNYLALDKKAYEALAADFLEFMVQPKNAMLLGGFEDNPQGYKKQLQNPDSELSKIVENLCRHSGMDERELTRLVEDSAEAENYEFSARIRDYLQQKGRAVK